jgi:Domain of unknown function (DUF1707)
MNRGSTPQGVGAMYENIRVSDADREQVAERLREHYAAGRLSSDEFDERLSATLSAKTFGDLRAVMADLPEPGTMGPQGMGPQGMGQQGWGPQGWSPQGVPAPRPAQPMHPYRRGPRLMPILLVALAAILLLHGAIGFVFFNFFLIIFVFGMVALITGAARFRRHVRRHWQSGYDNRGHWHHYDWHQ